MKSIKKLCIFTLILICSAYFMFRVNRTSTEVIEASSNSTTTSEVDTTKSNSEYQNYLSEKKLFHKEMYGNDVQYKDGENIIYYPTGADIVINKDEITQSDESVNEFKVNIPSGKAGFYNVYLTYQTVEGYSSSIERIFKIQGPSDAEPTVPYAGADTLTFSRVWADSSDAFDEDGNLKTDTRGNELKPKQIEKLNSICESYFKDYMGYETEPFEFYFEEGESTVVFEASKEPVIIKELKLVSVSHQVDYKTYEGTLLANNELKLENNVSDKLVTIQAERASAKSSPTLYPTTDRSSSKTEPYSYTKTLLNSIGGNSWKVLGDWIEWEFEVPEDGYYNISMRAKQNMVRGMYSSRIVYVDGEVLFDELNDVQFSYENKWQNVTLGDEDGDFIFFFKKGEKHTIRMEVTLGQYSVLIERLQEMVNKLNTVYREIISYTTVTPDANRDYQLHERFPLLKAQLQEYSDELEAISNSIADISDGKSDKTGVIDSVVIQLDDFLKDNLRTIPSRLNTFSNNISSLGTLLNSLRELPLMIDEIYVHTPDVELEKPNEGFFRGLWDGIVSFFLSFFIDYSSISETESNKESTRSIEVWMTLGRDQANVIRNLIDTDFTKKTGVKVELKLTGADVLLKATLAGIGPDVALNVDSSLPVNYALRNAVLDLSPFIYELDKNGAILKKPAIFFNADGSTKLMNELTEEQKNGVYPVVKDHDFGFVWNGETYEEAVVRRVYEIEVDKANQALADGTIDKVEVRSRSYEEIVSMNLIPDNFYMDSSLSQFQFEYHSHHTASGEKIDERHLTTGTYALPEKQIFLMMFVRDDIMDEKGLSAMYDWDNMTWDDVIDLVAELQTDQLQFYLPVNDAGANALNPVFLTLLYQRGGSLYINGNMETGLGSAEAMDSFEQWTEFYTLYSFPKSASFVNRFRTGEMPIGIAYYELYNTLSVFAPELKGKWSFHLIPGMLQEDGTINHTAVASGTGCVVLKQPAEADPQVKEDAFAFAKWWSSYNTQVSFGREMEGILGSAGRHTTANVKALNALAWPKKDLNILMTQWEQSREISQIAGSYITGREMENAYRKVINNLLNPREVLFEYANSINLEIDRKRKEFALETLDEHNKVK